MTHYKRIGDKTDRIELSSLMAEKLLQAGLPAFKRDVNQLLVYLHEALEQGSTRLLSSYFTTSRHVSILTTNRHSFYSSDPTLDKFFSIVKMVLTDNLLPDDATRCSSYLDSAVSSFLAHSNNLQCCIPGNTRFTGIATGYLSALLASDRDTARQLIITALEQDEISIKELYLHVFQPVQYEVGRLWLLNKISVTEEHYCTAATQAIMSDIYPRIISSRRAGKTLVAACVGAELHEIGVRMVADFFEMEGWDTFYLGAGVSPDAIISAISTRKADLVALSATMTYHVPLVQELITAIRNISLESTPLIMVGGMPFNSAPDLWREVGADLWAVDAEQAVRSVTG
jgi:methanogenic corrinoid protein MtbC1